MLTQDIKILFCVPLQTTFKSAHSSWDACIVNCSKVIMKYIPVVSIKHILQISQRSSKQLHFNGHFLLLMDKDMLGNSFLLGIPPYMQKTSNIDWDI